MYWCTCVSACVYMFDSGDKNTFKKNAHNGPRQTVVLDVAPYSNHMKP